MKRTIPISRRHFLGGMACSLVAAAIPGCATVPLQHGLLREGRIILDLEATRKLMEKGTAILVDADGLAGPLILLRHQGQWRALSAVCTHQNCQIRPQTHMLACPCHGSTFDLAGKVTRGPAPADLPSYRVEQNADTIEILL
jgi:Rieske Fe-S protein